MTYIVVFCVTTILTSNYEVKNSETDLHRFALFDLKLDLDLVFWVTSILTSIDEVKNSKIDLQRPWSFILTLYLEFLAPFTYKKTPYTIHMTSILTSNNEVLNLETDLQRPGTFNLKLDVDFLAPFTHKKTPHMTHILVFWVTSILTLLMRSNTQMTSRGLDHSFWLYIWNSWPQLPIKRHPTWHTLKFVEWPPFWPPFMRSYTPKLTSGGPEYSQRLKIWIPWTH